MKKSKKQKCAFDLLPFHVIEAAMDKIMGRSEFTGVSPADPLCGKNYI